MMYTNSLACAQCRPGLGFSFKKLLKRPHMDTMKLVRKQAKFDSKLPGLKKSKLLQAGKSMLTPAPKEAPESEFESQTVATKNQAIAAGAVNQVPVWQDPYIVTGASLGLLLIALALGRRGGAS